MGHVNTPVLYVLEGPISGDCVQGQETDDAVYPMVRCLIFGIYSCASPLHFTGLCVFCGKDTFEFILT